MRPGPAGELGLEPGIPVVAGAGDTIAAAVGLGITANDSLRTALLGLGTAGQLAVATRRAAIDSRGRLNLFCHAQGDRCLALAAVLDAGGALRWLAGVAGHAGGADRARDGAGDLIAEAAAVPIGADGLLFLPHLSGERTPGMSSVARAHFVGLRAPHGRGHLARAVLEGVAYSLREGMDVLWEVGLRPAAARSAVEAAGPTGGSGSWQTCWAW